MCIRSCAKVGYNLDQFTPLTAVGTTGGGYVYMLKGAERYRAQCLSRCGSGFVGTLLYLIPVLVNVGSEIELRISIIPAFA